MEDWNELWSFEDTRAVQTAAAQTLKNCGISLPRGSEKINAASSRSKASAAGASFGVSLRSGQQPTVTYNYGEHGRFKVPRFLVEAAQFLEEHSSFQGLFRKAGSVSRQKALRAALDSGNPSIPSDANVHDIASLLKQYLRELPEPLITSHLLPVFEACYSLPSPTDRQRCILLSCLFLPQVHLECLCVLMKLLHCVSESCSENLMDASNLAIVLAPNIIRPNISFITPAQGGNPLKTSTGIVQLLIESAPWIGHVPSNVYTVKKPSRVEVVPPHPVQKYKRIAQVYSHEKPEVAAPVVIEDSNGRNVHRNPQGNIVQNGLDSQNNIRRIEEKASSGEPKTQKVPDNAKKLEDSTQKSPESTQKMLPDSNGGLKSQERATKVQSLPENGLNVHKLPDKLQASPAAADGLLKTQSNKSESAPAENGPTIQHSQDIAQNSPTRREEKGVEPVSTASVLNEEEHPPSLTNQPDKEIITPTSWTGSLLFIGLIGLLVLIVAVMLPNIIHVW